jgi:hypothetical protein
LVIAPPSQAKGVKSQDVLSDLRVRPIEYMTGLQRAKL